MSFLFKPKPKSPQLIVQSVRDSLYRIDGPDWKKATDEVTKTLQILREMLKEGDATQVAQEIHKADLLQLLILKLPSLEFETKKDVVSIFGLLLRSQLGHRHPTVDYLSEKSHTLFAILHGFDNPEIALNCGTILKDCVKYPPLTKVLLDSPEFYKFFKYIQSDTFDISSNAFSTFKDILTRQKELSSTFLVKEYDKFFEHFYQLLMSANYVTKRQSLKLLSEILMSRTNFEVMTRFIGCPENLKTIMNLLHDPSKSVQIEAYHVFKVFVANPHKPPAIAEILRKNQEKLVAYLNNLSDGRNDEMKFNEEKTYLLRIIHQLT
ncbi:Mo25-like protein [Basidiobolus meristosporus CBS 931.73]|uniref:Mo25-like protein n=1 Tax=Basidiobolus meristosporus CBS 931.73 TaxID=1314790 RepID=A0A1Y1VW99_9FUNG|nr:Mo25-like protein [Basidiobolus meristosporus CBS 931.73]ORX75441.1 Mo25-like protein [Basidiobolus meristosporus CBS 931.73]|eukprot:ORX65578.1 Mo25-like protein [Basidiobolus meristosporus CBS 931.73]